MRVDKKKEEKKKRKKEGEKKKERMSRREREREKEKKGFPFLFKIYGNRTVGFSRSKRQSWSMHRELRVGIKILEFH